jgi:hypothetical protein
MIVRGKTVRFRSYKDCFQGVKRDETSPESAHNDVNNYLLLLGEAWTVLRYNNNNNNNNNNYYYYYYYCYYYYKFDETIDNIILAKEQFIKRHDSVYTQIHL